MIYGWMGNPVDSTTYFGEVKETTIWTKFYTYRSNLAHGNESDFKKE